MRLCACEGWCKSAHFAHTRQHYFAWCDPDGESRERPIFQPLHCISIKIQERIRIGSNETKLHVLSSYSFKSTRAQCSPCRRRHIADDHSAVIVLLRPKIIRNWHFICLLILKYDSKEVTWYTFRDNQEKENKILLNCRSSAAFSLQQC